MLHTSSATAAAVLFEGTKKLSLQMKHEENLSQPAKGKRLVISASIFHLFLIADKSNLIAFEHTWYTIHSSAVISRTDWFTARDAYNPINQEVHC